MTYDEILSEMRTRYRELSGFDADAASDIGIRLKVLSAEAASVYEQINELKTQIFPQTSSGKYLDMHAETRGITRKPAVYSQGMLTFLREMPAMSDILIPEGIICGTKPEPQVLFETLEPAVLAEGETSVRISAIAQTAGEIGNVAAGTVCMMISPAAGITSVINEDAFTGGVEEETDSALKNRLLLAFQNISNGTNSAFYYDLAMSHEGVSSVNVLPRQRGRGTVDVVVACADPVQQSRIVDEISRDFAEKKEINVDVLVLDAIVNELPVTVQIAPKSGHNYELVAEHVRSVIQDYVNGLGVGEPFLAATLGGRLMAVDGVYNHRITSPANDFITLKNHVLRPGAVTVSRMAVG